jgi:hypothetical protein
VALASSWVDRIHARLLVRYGAAWLRMWEGIDPELVKVDWGMALDGMTPNAIQHALEHLPPDRPPTVLQFKALAANRPRDEALAIEGPPRTKDPEKWREAWERFREIRKGRTMLSWAYDLQERERRGEDLLPTQREAWRRALETPAAETQQMVGTFTPIPEDCLPPGMRKDAR